MREIKFRAWGPNSNYMWSWGELVANDTSVRWLQPHFGEKILMQFTGLKDKDGKDIYDGDIVTISYGIPPITENLQIVWINDEVHYGWFFKNLRNNGVSAPAHSTYQDSITIIGNIHENPELLT
jgi:uncharacterized phage protein (TIGR01671 family)